MPLTPNHICTFSHFTGLYDSIVWGAANLVAPLAEGIGFTSVNEGSFATTIDEPGGVLAITTDTADNDNAALVIGRFFPRDGGCRMVARFKYSNVDCAIFAGFAETLALDTPVMPAEFATATMTYNPGNMVGFNYDVDGTTDDFRALMGDGSAAISDSGNGTRASATVTADRWFEAEVVVNADGSAECWLSDSGHVNGDGLPTLRLIKHFTSGTLLTTTDPLYAVLMIENRSAAARVLEVDYFGAEGNIDRRCD